MIVCGTRLDELDVDVERMAALLAARRQIALRLVHVSEDSRAPVVLGTDEERILGDVRQRLNHRAAAAAQVAGAQVSAHLAAGAVVHALESVARIELADLIVVGTGAGSDWNVLGSTSERLTRSALMPVLTVRDPGVLTSWLEGLRPLRILVAADTGRAGTSARAFAVRLATLAPAEVTVAYVADPETTHRRLGIRTAGDGHTLHADALRVLEKALLAAAPPGEVACIRVVPGRGSPDARVVGLADAEDFDLIVVGRRRESLLEQIWYGSVARGVLRAAPCSVVCVPPTDLPAPLELLAREDVVLGIDTFPSDLAACRAAIASACVGGRVHLAHVIDGPGLSTDDLLSRKAAAWHQLTRLVAQLHDEAGNAKVSLVPHALDGRAAGELIALSERTNAQLLVLRRSNRTAAGRVLLGSVARSVTEASPIPVLLLPSRVD